MIKHLWPEAEGLALLFQHGLDTSKLHTTEILAPMQSSRPCPTVSYEAGFQHGGVQEASGSAASLGAMYKEHLNSIRVSLSPSPHLLPALSEFYFSCRHHIL